MGWHNAMRLEVGGRRLWMWDVGSEISNFELRIANLIELNPNSAF